MQKRWVVLSLVISFLSLFSAGCGPSHKSVKISPVKSLGTPVTNGSIPANSSVSAVNPAMIAQFGFQQPACREPDGTMITFPATNDITEVVTVSENYIARHFLFLNGCQLIARFEVLGIDSQRMVLGNAFLGQMINGQLDANNQCAETFSMNGVDLAAFNGTFELKYLFQNGELTLLHDQSVYGCEPGQNSAGIYLKQ